VLCARAGRQAGLWERLPAESADSHQGLKTKKGSKLPFSIYILNN